MTRIAYFIGGSMDLTKRAMEGTAGWPIEQLRFARFEPFNGPVPNQAMEWRVPAMREIYTLTGRSRFAPDTYFYAYQGDET